MNASTPIVQGNTDTAGLEFASRTLSVALWVAVGVNAVGIVANAILLVGLLLLHGKGHLGAASVQMLVQQASVDLILNGLSIGYAFRS